MLKEGLVIAGTIAALSGLLLAFLAQRYWFARAWRFSGRIQDARTRKAFHTALLVVMGSALIAAVVGILRDLRGWESRGSFLQAFLGFWLTSSILSYIGIKFVDCVDWVWRGLRSRFTTREEPVEDVEPSAPALVHVEAVDHSRRRFFHAAGVVAGAVPFLSAGYGFVAERFRYQVREVTIPVANLPKALDGLRITQLSDVHASSYMPISEVGRAVGLANELNADLIVVTGDFITMRGDPLDDCIAELAGLRAPLGVWGCNGNHEVYVRGEARSAELFRRHGMRLLRQENAEIRWRGSAFNLIGVDYQRQRDAEHNRVPMLVGGEKLVRGDIPNILLSHNPNSFPRASELGIELSLAGHTHGGQVHVEILDHDVSPALFLTRYVAGGYQRPLRFAAALSDAEVSAIPGIDQLPVSKLYVNRGLGTIGAPIRLGVPPEISLITLRSA